MEKEVKNKSGESGFLQLIILILIALFIMKYFDITITDVVSWFKTTFDSVLK